MRTPCFLPHLQDYRASEATHLRCPHLGPAYLSWGRGDTAAGAWAPSQCRRQPGPGLRPPYDHGRDEKGAARGSVAQSWELSVGVPEASCW